MWLVLVCLSQILGCTSTDQAASSAQTVAPTAGAVACSTSENLLVDSGFTELYGGVWVAALHGGEPSFDVSVSEGVLKLERTGPEPWMTLRQWVDLGDRQGGTLTLTADLKGDLQSDPPLHSFKHVAGLLLKPDGARRSLMAEHDPNDGTWDWQPVSMSARVPSGAAAVQAGFIHQTGGTLWVRNPRLVWSDCEEAPGGAS